LLPKLGQLPTAPASSALLALGFRESDNQNILQAFYILVTSFHWIFLFTKYVFTSGVSPGEHRV